MTSHVGGAGGVTAGTGGRSGRTFVGVAGRGVGGNGGGARRAAPYFTTRPGPRCCNRLARPVVLRAILLEEWEHMLRAIRSPERQ
jgi:hypothetical protein